MDELKGLKTVTFRPRDPNGTYISTTEIEKMLKTFPFVRFPKDYDFNNAQHRFITNSELASINNRKRQLRDRDFELFMSRLEIAEIGESIVDAINNLYYGNPLFMTAITSGATIDLDALLNALVTNKKSFAAIQQILTTFYAEILFASFQGVIRDYYTTLIVAQNGKADKPSRLLTGVAFVFLDGQGKFEICFDKDPTPQIINILRDDLSDIKSYGRAEKLNYDITLEYVRHSLKCIDMHMQLYK